ncbi:MAG: hypothetical protein ACQERK_04710 [Campylobacterota bacterium]
MKVSINCSSLLLQKSLENFLKRNIVSKNRADFVISDKEIAADKPLFVIGRDMDKPFSRSRLFMALEAFEKKLQTLDAAKQMDEELQPNTLQQEIETLTRQFVKDIMRVIEKNG